MIKIVVTDFQSIRSKTLEMKRGEMTLLYGDSGVGKSTCMRAVEYALHGNLSNPSESGGCSTVSVDDGEMLVVRKSKPRSLSLSYLGRSDKVAFTEGEAQSAINSKYGTLSAFRCCSYVRQNERNQLLMETNSGKVKLIEEIVFDPILNEYVDKVKLGAMEGKRLAENMLVELGKERSVAASRIDSSKRLPSVEEFNSSVEPALLEQRKKKAEAALEEAKLVLMWAEDGKRRKMALSAQERVCATRLEEARRNMLSDEALTSLEAQMEVCDMTSANIIIVKRNREEEIKLLRVELAKLKELSKADKSECSVKLTEFNKMSSLLLPGERGNVGEALMRLTTERDELAKKLGEHRKRRVDKSMMCPACDEHVGIDCETGELVVVNDQVLVASEGGDAASDASRLDVVEERIKVLGTCCKFSEKKRVKYDSKLRDHAKYCELTEKLEGLTSTPDDVNEVTADKHKELTERHNALKAKMKAHNAAIGAMESADSEMQRIALEKEEVAKLPSSAEQAGERVKSIKAQLDKCKSDMSVLAQIQERERLESELETVDVKVRKCESEVSSFKQVKRLLEESRILFLNGRIEDVNESLAKYVDPLFVKVPVSVRFATVKVMRKRKNEAKLEFHTRIAYKGKEFTDVSDMSGGEMTRISIASTLAFASTSASPFLILDESINSIESDVRTEALEQLSDCARASNKALIMVCHTEPIGSFHSVVTM
jgi:ABC-type lipoprotein export system ATPase subunit